jgi:hypothetical protein
MHSASSSCDTITSWISTLSVNDNNLSIIEAAGPLEASHFAKENWQSFWRFYQAEWFFRVWVIQEAQQCEKVQLLCGDLEIEWGFVAIAATKAWTRALGDYVTHWKKDLFPSYAGFINANLMWD